jgi:WD40 repeat protein
MRPIAGTHLGDLPGEYGAAPLPLGRTSTHALIATMGATGDIRIRDPFTSRLHTTLAGSAGTDAQRDGSRVRAVHPGGDWLVVSDDHGSLTAWLTADGERKQLSQAYGEFVTACSVTRDGSMLAITRKSGVLHVWESATWQQIATMRADGPLTDCCWSPFGEHIYAVGERGAYCFDAP